MLALKERKGFGLCVLENNENIFVATGLQDSTLTSSCEIFDIPTNTWRCLSNVNVPLIGSSLTLFNKHSIYKFGGIDATGKVTKIIEKYNIH